MKDSAVKRWSAVHVFVYRATGGLVGRRLVNNDMLLLTTRGALTGGDHTVPLLYLADGDRYVVVASYGGRPDHPRWFKNLLVEPSVRVQVKSRRLEMVARVASCDERSEWWPRFVAAYGDYAVYQSRTNRVIPIVALDPAKKS